MEPPCLCGSQTDSLAIFSRTRTPAPHSHDSFLAQAVQRELHAGQISVAPQAHGRTLWHSYQVPTVGNPLLSSEVAGRPDVRLWQGNSPSVSREPRVPLYLQ